MCISSPWTKCGIVVFYFFKLGDINPFVSSLIPVFWTSDDVCPGFQNLSVARMATKSLSDILVQAAVAVETATQCVNV